MKMRIRGMTSRDEKKREREKEKEITIAEHEWQNDASERRASSHRRRGVKQRGTKEVAGRFARVATLSCERREETKWMTAKRERKREIEKRSVDWSDKKTREK